MVELLLNAFQVLNRMSNQLFHGRPGLAGAVLFFAFVCGNFVASAQTDTVIQRLFLLGDAGQLEGNSIPVLEWLKKNVNWNDEKNVALFLGDNIYPDGLPDEGDAEYDYPKKVIDYELSLVKGKKSKAYFVPGNHDWKGGKIGGWERAINQVNYINSLQAPNISAYPFNGCPGPIPVELNEKVVLVMMDTQWFLHVHDKPGPESACEARTIDEFTSELKQIADAHPNQLLVLVMHHPMYTYGVHGGAYTWRQHIFPFADAIKGLYIPLPVLGSVYPLARGLFGSLQDTYHPLYKTMINEIEKVLKTHPNPIAVAGHEHSMQLIVKDSIPYVVSGSVAKLTRLREGKNSLFSRLENGFSVLEISKSGKVEVKFYNLQTEDLNTPVFAKELKKIVPQMPTATMDTLLPVIGKVDVAAGPNLKASSLRRFLFGENYRKEWTRTISVPMIDLGSEVGGLKPVRQEGSRQAATLRLADKAGKEWNLRTIEKFPEAVIPSDLRSSVDRTVLKDGVSGAYPFASLSVPLLEKAVGMPTLRRKLFYVPDDPRLERFRTGFKNTLALLEEREPAGSKKTISTEDVVLQKATDNNITINARAVLRARLMDNFVMDFDRHEGKWRWASNDTGKAKTYYPIGHDHDQAFFKSEGLITSLLHHPWVMPETQGLRPKSHNIRTFNKTARNFDRYFLTSLTQSDWEAEIDYFLSQLTDDVIANAMQQQPPEIKQYNADEIAGQLKKRKAFFKNEMVAYYRFLSKEVNVVGTNQRELITIDNKGDGGVLITVHKMDSAGSVSSKIYERLFQKKETKEVRIYALEGDDSLVVKGNVSSIRIRLIGGPGNDYFLNEGVDKNVTVYDASFEKNTFTGNAGFQQKKLGGPEVNRYNYAGFKYNYIYPRVEAGYNKDDGFLAGATVEYFHQGFRKEPYGMRQFLQVKKAFGIGGWRLRYEADYMKAFKNMDVLVAADVKGPGYVTNFFGIGNNTVFDKARGIQYYRTQYTHAKASLLFGKQLQSWMRVGIGPAFEFIAASAANNYGKFVSSAQWNGANMSTIFQNKTQLGVAGRIDINSRNSPVLPTRGALIKLYAQQLFGINNKSKSFFQSGMDLRIFMSLVSLPRFVLATRVGLARNFGKFEYQQAQYLNGTDNLRGYRKDRFAGSSFLFNNTELRIRLFNFPTYIFSGSAGLLAFHDVGRVWADDERSGRWHNGYGGGLWVSPLKRFVLVGSLAWSKEEKAFPMVSFGFQF